MAAPAMLAAGVLADAAAFGSLAILVYPVGELHFANDGAALRRWIDYGDARGEPELWSRCDTQRPFILSILPPLEDAETWADNPNGPRLVANTTRACYWRTPDGFIATGPDDAPPVANGAGYPRLDALMRLKGESADTIERTLRNAVLEAAKKQSVPIGPDLAMVTGRDVDGAQYLTGCGWMDDKRAALIMPWADAVAIALIEETKAAATRSPDHGVYQIKAAPYKGPALYTLADYRADQIEADALDALYGGADDERPGPGYRYRDYPGQGEF